MVGTAAFITSTASAYGFIGGPVYADGGCYATRRVLTPFGYRWRTVNVCY